MGGGQQEGLTSTASVMRINFEDGDVPVPVARGKAGIKQLNSALEWIDAAWKQLELDEHGMCCSFTDQIGDVEEALVRQAYADAGQRWSAALRRMHPGPVSAAPAWFGRFIDREHVWSSWDPWGAEVGAALAPRDHVCATTVVRQAVFAREADHWAVVIKRSSEDYAVQRIQKTSAAIHHARWVENI